MASLSITQRRDPQQDAGGSGRRRPTRARFAWAAAAAALAAASLAPAAFAADPLQITTSYPAIVVAPGAKVSFNVSITTTTPQRVDLALAGAPASWNAKLHGGGFVVDAVETNGTDATTVRVDLEVPSDASGTTRLTLTGRTAADTVTLPLEVRVDPNASGAISIKNDIPALRGPSTQTFNFSLSVVNDTTEDETFSATGAGPTGWTVNTTLTGQSQAASAVVKANSTAGITVAVTPPATVDAGTYKLQVATSVAGQTLISDLQVEITGTYTMTLGTTDGRLNARGGAGSASTLAFEVTNTGTAPITNVTISGNGPTDWTITFDNATIASLAPSATQTVTATITASGNAIAGDYPLTFAVTGDNATRESVEIRYTVETSPLWGVVGAALIVAVVAGVWYVFQRYGRR